MNDIYTIKLKTGLGDLRFGASQKQVIVYLGKPDRIDVDDDLRDIIWYYDILDGYVSFDEDDEYGLGTIEVSSKLFTLNNRNLIGKSKSEVLSFLNDCGINGPEVTHSDLEDDNDQRSLLLHYEGESLNLWFEDDFLTEIQWGYLINDNDQVIWPE
jgi:hypothetical protein